MPTCGSESSKNRALLAFRVNRGTSASFSLSLSEPPGSSPLKDQHTTKSLVTTYHHTKILHNHWLCCTFHSRLIYLLTESLYLLISLTYFTHVPYPLGFPDGSLVKNSLAKLERQEMQVWSLSWKDTLEWELVTHSSILAWKIPWTDEPGWWQSKWSQRVGPNWLRTHSETFALMIANCFLCLWLFLFY